MDVIAKFYGSIVNRANNWRGCLLLVFMCSMNVYAIQYIYPGPLGGYTTFTLGGSLRGGDTLTLNGNMLSNTGTLVNSITPVGDITLQPYLVDSIYTLQSPAITVSTRVIAVRNRVPGVYTIQQGVNIQASILGLNSSFNGVELSSISADPSLYDIRLNGDIAIDKQANSAFFSSGFFTVSESNLRLLNNGNITITSVTDNLNLYGIYADFPLSFIITNNGNIDVTSNRNTGVGVYITSYFDGGTISNNGTIIAGFCGVSLYGEIAPIILNNTGTITATSNDVNAAAIDVSGGLVTANLNGGSINGKIKGINTLNFGNNAITTVNGNLESIGSVAVATGATAQINGNSTITTTFISNGTVAINGNRTLSATSYTNSGAQNFTITDQNVYDSLTCNCPVDLSGATINVSSSFVPVNNIYSWNILSSTNLQPPANFVFSNIFLHRWVTTVNATTVNLQLVFADYSDFAIGAFNYEVAQVLDQMDANITNSSQQQLINIFNATTNSAQFNNALHQMMPISNSIVSNAQMQSMIFHKVGTRIAALQNNKYLPFNSGINAGELAVSNGMWLTSSGSVTKQHANEMNDGYSANSAVILLGLDIGDYDNMLGFGGGYSFSRVKELSNADFVNNISRYHGVLYGSHNEYNVFLNWLLLGSYDNNAAHRNIQINSNNLNTHADFNSWQIAAKLERGVGLDFSDAGRFSPSAYIQYAFLHQNAYTETGSIAALQVQSDNKNIATVGGLGRLNFPFCTDNVLGSIELRAGASYDVINNNNTTTANFIIGSEFFTVVSSPERLAAQAGGGVMLEFSEKLQLSLDYNFEYRDGFNNNTGLLKLKYVF